MTSRAPQRDGREAMCLESRVIGKLLSPAQHTAPHTQLVVDGGALSAVGNRGTFPWPLRPVSKQELNLLNLSEQKTYINLRLWWPGSGFA
jgi:hypothetical protein